MSVIETHAVPMSLVEEWRSHEDEALCTSFAAWALQHEIDVVFVIDTEHPEEKPQARFPDAA